VSFLRHGELPSRSGNFRFWPRLCDNVAKTDPVDCLPYTSDLSEPGWSVFALIRPPSACPWGAIPGDSKCQVFSHTLGRLRKLEPALPTQEQMTRRPSYHGRTNPASSARISADEFQWTNVTDNKRQLLRFGPCIAQSDHRQYLVRRSGASIAFVVPADRKRGKACTAVQRRRSPPLPVPASTRAKGRTSRATKHPRAWPSGT